MDGFQVVDGVLVMIGSSSRVLQRLKDISTGIDHAEEIAWKKFN
jgi:hypothetical protein